MGKAAYSPFISSNNITVTRRTVILKMTENVARIKKIKLIKQIKNISVARGQKGQFLQAISHSCEMTKIFCRNYFSNLHFFSLLLATLLLCLQTSLLACN